MLQVWEEVLIWEGGARLAIASRTDEPSWAREILGKFKSTKGNVLLDLVDFNLIEMYEVDLVASTEFIKRSI
jgi:hypothetical protein